MRAQSTDGVCFVDEEVELGGEVNWGTWMGGGKGAYFVLLFELHYGWEVDKCAFHTVQPLDDD